MRTDVLLTIKDTLEDVQKIKVLSMSVEDNTVFGIYINDIKDSLSFLTLPKNHFETTIDNINIHFFELGSVLHIIYFNGALKFLDILYPDSKIIEHNSEYIDLCNLVLENVPFNIAKLKYIEAFNQEFDYGTDVEKVLMLMEIANDFNLTLLMWHKESMNNFVYVNEINNENDFILAYNSLNGFKEWLQEQKFIKISEKNLHCIDEKYINIQKLNIEV